MNVNKKVNTFETHGTPTRKCSNGLAEKKEGEDEIFFPLFLVWYRICNTIGKHVKIMTQEEKQLLLKDLCARLPYGVKGRYCLYDSKGNLTDWGNEPEIVENIDFKECKIWTDDTVQGYNLDEFKPYLRPLSSMTEEEKEEFQEYVFNSDEIGGIVMLDASDWLNEHHFDWRGLIPMGLALEVPEGMYK